jgi:sarcosine oxidase/L-pipecolate oxidase
LRSQANYRSGVVVRGLHNQNFDGRNARITYDNVKSEAGVEALNTPQAIKHRLTPRGTATTANVPDKERSYWNPVGGWAHAAKAVEKLYEGIVPLGGKIVPGAELSELIVEGNNVKGVCTTDGRRFLADKVIVCTGSWTAAHPALSELIPQGLITATGQTICAVQLDDGEVERYKDIPVTFNFDGSGFYSFPVSDAGNYASCRLRQPNQTGLVKFAIHGAGYTSPTGVPRTALDPKALSYTEVNQVGECMGPDP